MFRRYWHYLVMFVVAIMIIIVIAVSISIRNSNQIENEDEAKKIGILYQIPKDEFDYNLISTISCGLYICRSYFLNIKKYKNEKTFNLTNLRKEVKNEKIFKRKMVLFSIWNSSNSCIWTYCYL